MDWIVDISIERFAVFLLVLARVGGLTLTAPLFHLPYVPLHVRALMALAAAAMIAPAQFARHAATVEISSEFLLTCVVEVLIGVVLGLGVSILLGAARMTGQLIAQSSGLSLAEVLDPAVDAGTPVHSQFLYLFATAIYLSIGGHRLLMSGLLNSFSTLPIAQGMPVASLTELLGTMTTESFSLALRCAAPVVIALLLTTMSLALVARVVPQWNMLSIGFGVNLAVSTLVLCATLGAMAWLFDDALLRAIATLTESMSLPPIIS